MAAAARSRVTSTSPSTGLCPCSRLKVPTRTTANLGATVPRGPLWAPSGVASMGSPQRPVVTQQRPRYDAETGVDSVGACSSAWPSLARALTGPGSVGPTTPGWRCAGHTRRPWPSGCTRVVRRSGTVDSPWCRRPTPAAGTTYFLGVDQEDVAYFGVATKDPITEVDGVELLDLRTVGGLLDDRDAGLLVHAIALANWHAAHGFCSTCGCATEVVAAGHVRRCPTCGTEHYPRTDPAVIMLVTDPDDRALLGHNPAWPAGRFSTLAGFVEPGESAETAVVREVAEEAGVASTTCATSAASRGRSRRR